MDPKSLSTEEDVAKMEAWRPEPRETPADRAGDAGTAWRRLDRRLVLMVQDAAGAWGFPAARNAEGETIRETAERALREAVGEGEAAPRVYFVGNAPAGHLATGAGVAGAGGGPGGSLFFHRAQVLTPVDRLALVGEYHGRRTAWVARDEVDAYAATPEAGAFLRRLLID